MSITLDIAKRPRDWFFVCFFLFFFYSSMSSDGWHATGAVDAMTFWGRGNLWYARAAGDSFFLDDALFSRINTGISAFVFGPFYLVVAYAFLRGRNWIRLPALIYVGAMVHGVVEFVYWEYALGAAPTHAAVFWAFNGPYLVVPLLLAWRVWKPQPFTA